MISAFLIERYVESRGKETGTVLREWDEHSITKEIYASYPEYHTERLENAFEDIDSLLATGAHAW